MLRIPLRPRSRRPQTAPVLQPAPRAQTGAGIGNNSERLPGGVPPGGWTGPCHKRSRPRHTFRLSQVDKESFVRQSQLRQASSSGNCSLRDRPERTE